MTQRSYIPDLKPIHTFQMNTIFHQSDINIHLRNYDKMSRVTVPKFAQFVTSHTSSISTYSHCNGVYKRN